MCLRETKPAHLNYWAFAPLRRPGTAKSFSKKCSHILPVFPVHHQCQFIKEISTPFSESLSAASFYFSLKPILQTAVQDLTVWPLQVLPLEPGFNQADTPAVVSPSPGWSGPERPATAAFFAETAFPVSDPLTLGPPWRLSSGVITFRSPWQPPSASLLVLSEESRF